MSSSFLKRKEGENVKNTDVESRGRSRYVRALQWLPNLASTCLSDFKLAAVLAVMGVLFLAGYIAFVLAAYIAFAVPVVLGFPLFMLGLESPVIFYVYRYIQHEESWVCIESEAWENPSHKTTAELVDEWKELHKR